MSCTIKQKVSFSEHRVEAFHMPAKC